jgi:alginate O-acetyltransferase complex protein AlgI
MVFSSEIFLFLFLPLFLAVYYALPFRYRSYVIVTFSYGFYGWWRLDFLLLLIGMTLWVYCFGNLIAGARDERWARRFCMIGIAGCLTVLGIFKYLNFFIDSLAELVGTTPSDMGFTLRVILPIGISFFVFHAISYLVDILRKEVPPADRLADFAAFIALFPHLVAGPVLRYKDLSAQLRSRTHSVEKFAEGTRWFVFGLAKKVLIADSVAPIVTTIYSQPHPTFAEAWTGAIAYTVQLYFDFSGYSEMAIGLGLMVGIRFIDNFNFPYLSRSITEFWRRWHISLSVWLRDYLYIPLGGNRKGRGRTYVNLLFTMLLGGLWHGANWTFIVWGAWHGSLLALERRLGIGNATSTRAWFIGLPLTMLAVVAGWVLFRSPDFGTALDFYAGMLGQSGFAIRPEVDWQLSRESIAILVLAIVIIYTEPSLRRAVSERQLATSPGTASQMIAAVTGAVAILSVLRISDQSYSPFLYFQF